MHRTVVRGLMANDVVVGLHRVALSLGPRTRYKDLDMGIAPIGMLLDTICRSRALYGYARAELI